MDRSADDARLRRLGDGAPIADLCGDAGWTRADFDRWWADELARRTADAAALLHAPVKVGVDLLRDERGIPHVFASSDRDLFVGYGVAMAQDRLFQLEVQRRKGSGTSAELLGPDGLELDRIAHTIGFPDLAQRELDRIDAQSLALFEAFAEGVSLVIDRSAGALPIEFGLLDARPAPWTALDTLRCAIAYRWQFTGRPHNIWGPELLKRGLGDDRLVAAMLTASREADTPILPPDAVYPSDRINRPPGPDIGRGDSAGSNNWVVAGSRSRSGAPLLASDPHMPYQSFSAFYEIGLHGGSFDAVGAGFVGLPGLVFGRNRRLAWCITNNICSLRDLYQERPLDGPTPAFEFDGRPEAGHVRQVPVHVRGGAGLTLNITRTRNGPIIDDLLPPIARGTGPVSMRWLGTESCDWTAAQLRLARAGSVAEATAAVRGWLVPTFSLMLADVDGGIGYIATGEIPLRRVPERGYRPGWDPAHQWTGRIPSVHMPQVQDPERGWLASANNRPAPDDFPFPLSGTWDEGLRARHIGKLIEAHSPLGRSDLSRMHSDVVSTRAETIVDSLIEMLEPAETERERAALELLGAWDRSATADSAATAIYEVTFHRWAQAVVAERIADQAVADVLAGWANGLAAGLLTGDPNAWFAPGRREAVARATFRAALDELAEALGPDPSAWRWGAIHHVALRHPLGGRGDLGPLLNKPTAEVGGDLATLNNSGFEALRIAPSDPTYARAWGATSGAGYRIEVDLGETPARAWTITLESQSANPGSPHHDDQREAFLGGRTLPLPLDRSEVEAIAPNHQRLTPFPGSLA